MMTKEEIRSKIDNGIESGDVDLFIATSNEPYPPFAIIRGNLERMKPYNTDNGYNAAFRIDQKYVSEVLNKDWTKESILEAFVDSIDKCLSEGTIEAVAMWFRGTVKFQEKLNQLEK